MSAATVSHVLSLGDPAPDFAGLVGTDGRTYSLGTFDDATALVVVFVANGCPTVRLYEQRLAEIARRHGERGLRIVLVNSNNVHLSPPDAYGEMVERAKRSVFPFPYVKDADGALAKSCGAICTPHAFVFDADRRLRYRGRIDDNRTGRRVTSTDLEDAVSDVLEERPVRVPETEPFGCAIVR